MKGSLFPLGPPLGELEDRPRVGSLPSLQPCLLCGGRSVPGLRPPLPGQPPPRLGQRRYPPGGAPQSLELRGTESDVTVLGAGLFTDMGGLLGRMPGCQESWGGVKQVLRPGPQRQA